MSGRYGVGVALNTHVARRLGRSFTLAVALLLLRPGFNKHVLPHDATGRRRRFISTAKFVDSTKYLVSLSFSLSFGGRLIHFC